MKHGRQVTPRDVFSIKCMESDDIICPQSENSGLEIEVCNLFRA